MLRAAEDRYAEAARLAAAAATLAGSAWDRVALGALDSWRPDRLAARISALQLVAARGADAYLDDILAEQNLDAAAMSTVNARAFAGVAGDGRSLLTLLDQPRISAKASIARDILRTQDPIEDIRRRAWEQARSSLRTMSVTAVQDAGRGADSVAMVFRPAVTGYVRMLNTPSCARCAILAGKFFRWNQGFARHPRCDCRHIPSTESLGRDLRTNPEAAIRAGQVTGLSRADLRAIHDGADAGQVVNAHRGLYTADTFGKNVKATVEGTSRRGLAGAASPRLRPEAIYKLAGDDRDEALRLLHRFGYVSESPGARAARTAVTRTRVHQVPDRFTIGDTDTKALSGQEINGRFEYDPERLRRYHDPYVNSRLERGIPSDTPEFRVMGGGAASGKSSIIRSGDVQLPKGHVLVNADEAKEALPEYVAGVKAGKANAAAFVHEESSDMAKRLTAESLQSRFHTVLDGVGNGSIDSLAGKIQRARADGARRVIGDYVTVDTDEAIRRAIKRAEGSGRHVPVEVIRHGHETVSNTFREAVARGDLFDELRLWDNNGKSPRLIFSQIDGNTTVYDQRAYDAFLRKSPQYQG